MWGNSAFNPNQTFLSGGGLHTEIECGLLSPLCVPHVATPLVTPSLVLSFATGHLCLHPRCVIWSPSTAEVPNPLCVNAWKCAHVLCNPIILQSVVPPTGWAWYWHNDTCVSSDCWCSGGRQLNFSNNVSNPFCIHVNLLRVDSDKLWTVINHFYILHIQYWVYKPARSPRN